MNVKAPYTFQEFTWKLINYWCEHGCMWTQPYDMPMGAGTFHPHTFFKGIGPEPWRSVYAQPCRRPLDGRYGESPYRFQHYYQLQVLLKPAPANILDVYLKSLECVGISLKDNDICLLEDDWKGPTLGAWGLGWEVRANGQEVTQFTYFQQLGGLDLDVICGEITYGLERLYMYATGIKNALDIHYNETFTYGDIYKQNEIEFSHFNFKEANVKELFAQFDLCENNSRILCEKKLVMPAYDYILQASHSFNLLDARGVLSVSERQRYIGRVQAIAKQCAELYLQERTRLGFPMQARLDADPRQEIAGKNEGQSQSVVQFPSGSPENNQTFVIEFGVEEVPPKFLRAAYHNLAKLFPDAQVIASPRRMGVIIDNLPAKEDDKTLELWGPAVSIAFKDGQLSPAGAGFCKKNGVDPKDVQQKEKDGSLFLYVKKEVKGRSLPLVVAQQVYECLTSIPALKMRWLPENISPSFIRPVRWILALHGKEVIPVEYFGISSDRKSCGQRILSPEWHSLSHASDYMKFLNEKKVKGRWDERSRDLSLDCKKVVAKVNGKFVETAGLLDKVTGLAESPTPFIGEIENKYLALPKDLIVSVLRDHMNYFAIEDANGKLLPKYCGIATYPALKIEQVSAAADNVVAGRLADGLFYYETDLKTSLQDLREKTKGLQFHGNLGSMFDKSERLKSIVVKLSDSIQLRDLHQVCELAGQYAKSDLRTGCVQEFPDEMQGLMAGEIIRQQKPFGKDSDQIAQAISEHYLPNTAESALPSTMLGKLLSLADKMDTLVLMLSHGAEPKGSADPFGLRRVANGIVRILESDEKLKIKLGELIGATLDVAQENKIKISDPQKAAESTLTFIATRLKAAWKEQGFSTNVSEVAGSPKTLQQRDIYSAKKLVTALEDALRSPQSNLYIALTSLKRCRNILANAKYEKGADFKKNVLKEVQEKSLLTAYENAQGRMSQYLNAHKFKDIFEDVLSSFKDPLAQFFEHVMVNVSDEELKQNRLMLLQKICELYDDVADFSKMQIA